MAVTINASTSAGAVTTADTSGILQLQTNGTAALTVDASQNVGIGTASPAQKLDIASKVQIDTANSYGKIKIARATDSALALYIQGADNAGTGNELSIVNSGGGGAAINVTGGELKFFASSNTTERARIDSNGNLLVGCTTVNVAGTSDTSGFVYERADALQVSRNNTVASFNRFSSDGGIIAFNQDGTTEGTVSVSGTTVSYNGGHLSRWAQTTAPKDNTLVKGTVLSNLDEMNVYTKDGQPVENEQLNKVKVSDVEGDANVAGVFVNWDHDEAHNVDEINMAMTGDMIIRIAQGVTVARGDLLMSAGDGTAKPQGDDIVRSKTVAKVTSTHVTCTYADGSFCVPCVLMAC
jgi:hypothetical protein